jgi:predicted Fe-Mo cluster-binding NifX family protein
MNVPILGLVENYSYLECGNCGERISVFGKSHVNETAEKFKLPVLGRIPINPAIAESVDGEKIEELNGDWLNDAVGTLKGLLAEKKKAENTTFIRLAVPTDGSNNIFGHFGKATEFTLYEILDGTLAGKTLLTSAGGGHGQSVELMKREKINTVLCGGIGMEAMEGLMNNGILVVPGATGDADVAAAAYLDGSFQSGNLSGESQSVCSCNKEEHKEQEDCGCKASDSCNCH